MIGTIRRRARVAALFLGWLLFSAPAQAASFDCAKAGTKVEHIICDNPEISKLDEELNAAYKIAVQDQQQAGKVKAAQRLWMGDRNSCLDDVCVKAAYATRLALLGSFHASGINSNLSGQWHLAICDASISKVCGGFTVYLIQTENKICGDHYFATPGGGRLNEGAPRSIIGLVSDSGIADIEITSGRNGAVFRVRAAESDGTLNWTIMEELKRGEEGDSALILEKGNLKREAENGSYRAAISACQHY